MGLGRIKEAQGHKKEAEALYDQVLAKDPQNKEAAQFLSRLQTPPKQEEEPKPEIHQALSTAPPEEQKDAERETARALMEQQKYAEAIDIYRHLLEKDPTNTDDSFSLAQAYMRLDHKADALPVLEKILLLNPHHNDARTALAYLYLFEQQLDKAAALFDEVLHSQPNNLEALIGLGRVREAQHEPSQAEDLYRQALHLQPDRQDVLDYLARLHQPEKKQEKGQPLHRLEKEQDKEQSLAKQAKELLDKENYQKAIELYEQLIKTDSHNADYYFYLGQAYSRTHQKNQAMHAFEAALKIKEDYQDARAALAYLYLFDHDLKTSEHLFRIVLRHSHHYVDAIIGLGRIKLIQKKFAQAERLFKRALKIDPNQALAKNYLKQIQEEKHPVAKKKEPEKEKLPAWADAMYKQAEALEKEKQFEKALDLYRFLALAFPKNADYLFKLGKMYTRVNQPQLAKETFEAVLLIDHNYQDARSALAYLYLFDHDLETSQLLFELILRQSPRHVDALAGMGRIAMLTEDLCEAEIYFLSALKQDPYSELALNNYAQLLNQENRYTEAKPLFIQSIFLFPEERAIPRILFDVRGHTDPSLILRGSSAKEEEKDRFTGRRIARLIDTQKSLECILPIHDRFRIFARASSGILKQINLVAKLNLFDARIRTSLLRGEYLYTPEWTFNVSLGSVSASNRSKDSILPTRNSSLLNPSVSLIYNDSYHRFEAHSLTTFLLDKDFKIGKTYLIQIKDVGANYERSLEHQTRVGALGDYFLYEDRVNNRAFWLAGWMQKGILPPYEDVLALRYQIDYRRFKEEVPDYYTFQYQLTHWLALKFDHTWDDTLHFQAEYWHGWRWVKGKNAGSPLVTTPVAFDLIPVKKIFLAVDRIFLSLTKNIRDKFELNLTAEATRDSLDYTTWYIAGTVTSRF